MRRPSYARWSCVAPHRAAFPNRKRHLLYRRDRSARPKQTMFDGSWNRRLYSPSAFATQLGHS
eukprot:84049-Alexandrium_andersonii.AAC.1